MERYRIKATRCAQEILEAIYLSQFTASLHFWTAYLLVLPCSWPNLYPYLLQGAPTTLS